MTRPETYDELVEFRARLIEPVAWDRKDAGMAESFWAYACWKSMVRARATFEEERAVGIVPVPLEATEEMVFAENPMVKHLSTEEIELHTKCLNAAIAATPYQEDGK